MQIPIFRSSGGWGFRHSSDGPDPPIPAFFDFLAFFRFPIFLAFILGVPQREKPLLFFCGKTLAFSKKARVGGSGGRLIFTTTGADALQWGAAALGRSNGKNQFW